MAQSDASKRAKPLAAKSVVKKVTEVVPKKAVKKANKGVVKKDGSIIKYADKSKGQPKALGFIFDAIKNLLLPYEKDDMKLHAATKGQATLINHKPVEIDGRKKTEMWFASALIQKGYVGFYYMPVYMNEKVRKQLKPELLKCLKGKACFHITKEDPVIYAQIKDALKFGFADYRQNGWL